MKFKRCTLWTSPGLAGFLCAVILFVPLGQRTCAEQEIELPWFDLDPVTVIEAWPGLMQSEVVSRLLANPEELRPWLEQAFAMLNQADWSELVENAGPIRELIGQWGTHPVLEPWSAEIQALSDYLAMAQYVDRVPPARMQGEPAVRTTGGKVGTAARAGTAGAGSGGKVGTAARVGTAAKAGAQPPREVEAKPAKPAASPGGAVGDKEQELASVERWRKLLSGRPVPSGAAKWEDVTKKAFAKQGVPPELVWMAEVESSWNPRAESPVGARGLFQLMPETARSLGLVVNSTHDDRADAAKNADAAARYLKRLHGRFGSWDLAVAAYNGGEGRVARAKGNAGSGAAFSRVSSKLPRETRMYVPKVFVTIGLREKVDPGSLPKPSAGAAPIPSGLRRHPDPVPITLN